MFHKKLYVFTHCYETESYDFPKLIIAGSLKEAIKIFSNNPNFISVEKKVDDSYIYGKDFITYKFKFKSQSLHHDFYIDERHIVEVELNNLESGIIAEGT